MSNREKLIDFLAGVLRPVAAALVIAVGAAFFEGAFPAPNVGGHWYCLTLTQEALGGEQYKGMFLLYDTFLRVNGEALTGNDEKFAEYSSGRKGLLPGDQRTTSTSSGNIHRKYFRDSHLSLVMDEDGAPRNSTPSYDMVIRGDRMAGTFHSTVANQTGRVVCKRASFDVTGGHAAAQERLRAEIDHDP